MDWCFPGWHMPITKVNIGQRGSNIVLTNLYYVLWKMRFIFIPLGPRYSDYDVLADTVFDREHAKALADAADGNWDAILNQDIVKFGHTLRDWV